MAGSSAVGGAAWPSAAGHHVPVTDDFALSADQLREHALADLAVLTDPDLDPRAAAIEASTCTRLAADAIQQLLVSLT